MELNQVRMTVCEELFDRGDEYAEMLDQGLQLSGEDQGYFIDGRLKDLAMHVPSDAVRRVLDFGCGSGAATARLAKWYPKAEILGVDLSSHAIGYARKHNSGKRIWFESLDHLPAGQSFDLCYCNGVFHHIPIDQRMDAARLVYEALVSGGRFALFENNPLNPGTRMVMKRIPFDRNAITLTPWQTTRLLRQAGFRQVGRCRFLFYFPRFLAALRFTEPLLVHLPLGAQYYALATKPASGSGNQ